MEAAPATTFRACSSPEQHQSSRNLHLQYIAKNQSTQRCQSLITQGSDHPPVLEPHMVLRGQVQAAWWHEKKDEVVDRSQCMVAAHDQSLHSGFAAVHHKTVGLIG
jgi:hypothetical protein